MEQKCCGIDVHRDTLVATIIDNTNQKQTQTFTNSIIDMEQLKNWLRHNNCIDVVMESTGSYWTTLYMVLEDTNFKPVLANAHQVKAIPGRKTDQRDSEWLAYLLRSDLIRPSYVPTKPIRELRELARTRVRYVESRTQYKNRCQKLLSKNNMRLSSVLSDVFGKAGKEILDGLMAGKTVEDILKTTQNKHLQKQKQEIIDAAKGSLSKTDIFLLKQMSRTIESLTVQIKELEACMAVLVDERALEVICSVPGVGRLSGATILAELGDPSRFGNGRQVASWCGFAPFVSQSAGVTRLGSITKRGSRWLRRVMVEVAHVAVRMDCRFKDMFWRIASKRCKNVAYVAVARKLLTVIWHLLLNDEVFVEEGFSKKSPVAVVKSKISDDSSKGLSLDDVSGVLGCAVKLVSVDDG
ncbi:MAG: IS110 family transposase [Candidatus Bathyarchaeota archaeon]|nr:IS110 family transposase [Candidatus Termiticorpusculum sp.]